MTAGRLHSKVSRNGPRAKDVIHISDKKAAGELASLLGSVRERAELVIENDARL